MLKVIKQILKKKTEYSTNFPKEPYWPSLRWLYWAYFWCDAANWGVVKIDFENHFS